MSEGALKDTIPAFLIRFFFVLVSVLCLSCHAPSSLKIASVHRDPADTLTIPSRAVFQRELDNGMMVLMKQNHTFPLVAVRLYVKTGAIYEGPYAGCGMSHYFEHILHAGTTTTRSETETKRILQEIGGVANAYTTKDHTCYYMTARKEHLGTILELIADWVSNATLSAEEVEREKGVILEEIRLRNENPGDVAYRSLYEHMFNLHPVRYPVIGYEDCFKRLEREDLLQFYGTYYVPNNMVLVITGDIDTESVFHEVTDRFAPLKRKPLTLPVLPAEPQQVAFRLSEQEMDTEVAYLLMGFHTVGLTDPDLYPVDVLSYILTNGKSSRLYRTIKEEKRLVYSISSWSLTPGYGCGVFVIKAVLKDENVTPTIDAIMEELDRLREEYVSDEELKIARRQKLSDYFFGLQTVQAEAADIGINYLEANDPHFTRRYVEEIQKVTKESIKEVVGTYFQRNVLTVSLVRPKKKAGLKESDTQKKTLPADRPVTRKYDLPNGMRLVVRRNPGVPVVALQAHFKGGVRYEKQDNNGISYFMTKMLLRGTRRRSAQDIAKLVGSVGARISSTSSNNSFNCSISCLKDDMDLALDLLSDVILNPSFDQDEMEKEREIMLAGIKSLTDNWEDEIFFEFRKAFFKNHPYRFFRLGSEQSISQINREQLVNFHSQYCRPDNMVLSVVGDVELEEVLAGVRKYFQDFKKKKVMPPGLPVVPVEPHRTESGIHVKYNDKRQVGVMLGFSGSTVYDNDRFAFQVLDAITSGIVLPGGRLHNALRGDNDLVYYVHAINWLGLDTGAFYVITQTSSQNLERVVTIMEKEIERLKTEEVSEEELVSAKNICLVVEDIYKQSDESQAQELALNELYGLGYDFYEKFKKGIEAVTARDVKRIAQKYLSHHLLVLTGPQEGIEKSSFISQRERE